MRKLLVVLMIVAIAAPSAAPVTGQTLFKNVMKERYDLKTISCFACHERVERGTENPKQYRNDLGKLFEKEFEGTDVTARLEAIARLKRDDPERVKVEEEVTKELEAILEKIEPTEAPTGGTYKEGFVSGAIEGFTPR